MIPGRREEVRIRGHWYWLDEQRYKLSLNVRVSVGECCWSYRGDDIGSFVWINRYSSLSWKPVNNVDSIRHYSGHKLQNKTVFPIKLALN